MIYIDLNIKSIQILGFPFLKDDPKFVCITIICFENLIKMHETKTFVNLLKQEIVRCVLNG